MRHRDLRNGAVAASRTTRQAAAAPLVSVLALAGIVTLLPDSAALSADLTEAEARSACAGNLCRCGTYPNVLEAALAAAKSAKKGG